jgi:hypothetical protein
MWGEQQCLNSYLIALVRELAFDQDIEMLSSFSATILWGRKTGMPCLVKLQSL